MPLSDSSMPPGGEEGDVLSIKEPGKPEWAKPASKIFRGAWQADTLAKQYDFAAGVDSVFDFVKTGTGGDPVHSALSISAAGAFPYYVVPGPFTSGIRASATIRNGSLSGIDLDLSQVGIKNISRVSAWMHVNDAFSSYEDYVRMSMYRNGTMAASNDPANGQGTMVWREFSTPADSDDVIRFAIRNFNDMADERIYGEITGIKIFTVSDPYMLGDHVTYDGKMWKSAVDNNGTTPGASASWVEVLDLPKAAGTTAQRPAPAAAGTGYPYFDTTLNKPVWVDTAATGWVDATGAAV